MAKSPQAYSTLLLLYPRSFRRQYAATMTQTFVDMVEAEPTKRGRVEVWIRTLLNLPISAGKEHITNGRDLYMNKNLRNVLTASVVAVLIVGAGSYWFGNIRARQSVGIERVTVGQLADAMQQDDFYSSYGNAAVLFSGTVSAVKQGDHATLVTFQTNRPFSVVCQFPSTVTVPVGKTLSVASPAGSAERETKGVLLHDCLIN